MKKVSAVALLLLIGGCNKLTGNGEKVGTIIKLSQEGYWVKTWQGEMVRGGMNGGSGAFSTKPLHFTISDLSLLPQVQKAFDEQKEVNVTYVGYSNVFGSFSSECNDDSGGGNCKFLTSIRER